MGDSRCVGVCLCMCVLGGGVVIACRLLVCLSRFPAGKVINFCQVVPLPFHRYTEIPLFLVMDYSSETVGAGNDQRRLGITSEWQL